MTIPVLPSLPGITYPVKRSPVWSSTRSESISGKVTELQKYSFPRWRYELPYELLRSGTQAELQALTGFFNSVKLAAGLFQFDDPSDNSAADQNFGQGDGQTTAFQLVRSFGGFIEPVYAPISPITISVAGTPTSGFTLGDGGVVNFNAAPADGSALTWTGNFRWLCRFDDDSITFENFMQSRWSLSKLAFTTEKM